MMHHRSILRLGGGFAIHIGLKPTRSKTPPVHGCDCRLVVSTIVSTVGGESHRWYVATDSKTSKFDVSVLEDRPDHRSSARLERDSHQRRRCMRFVPGGLASKQQLKYPSDFQCRLTPPVTSLLTSPPSSSSGQRNIGISDNKRCPAQACCHPCVALFKHLNLFFAVVLHSFPLSSCSLAPPFLRKLTRKFASL